MLEKNELSIVIPTFNRAHTLPRAIDSVLRQTDDRWRLIVVDDGSTDNTPDIMSSYKDGRILYHRYQPNRGASHARNLGAELSRTEYVAFFDSDDELLPEAVAEILGALERDRRLHWMYVFPVVDGRTGSRIGCLPEHDGVPITYQDVLIERYSAETFIAVHRRAFDLFHFSEEFLGYERMFWYSVLRDLGPGRYCHTPVRVYHQDAAGASLMQWLGETSRRAQENSKRQSLKYFELFGDDLLAVNRKAYLNELRKLGTAYLFLDEYREAERVFRQSWHLARSWRTLVFLVMAKMGTRAPLEIRNRFRRKHLYLAR